MTNNEPIIPQLDYQLDYRSLELLEDRADVLLLEAEVLKDQTEKFLESIQGLVQQLKEVNQND